MRAWPRHASDLGPEVEQGREFGESGIGDLQDLTGTPLAGMVRKMLSYFHVPRLPPYTTRIASPRTVNFGRVFASACVRLNS